MPAESAPLPPLTRTPSLYSPYKCDRCGARCVAGTASTSAYEVNVGTIRPGGLGRSYSDTVRLGPLDVQRTNGGEQDDMHPGDMGRMTRETRVAEAGPLVCGSCKELEVERGDTLSPLIALHDVQENTRSDEEHRVEPGARLGLGTMGGNGIGGVGLGLSLGRRGSEPARTAVEGNCTSEIGRDNPTTYDGGRPPSIVSDTSSPDLATLNLVDAPQQQTLTNQPSPAQPLSIPSTGHVIPSAHTREPEPGCNPTPHSLPTPSVLPWTTTKAPKDADSHAQALGTTKDSRARKPYDPTKSQDKPYQPLLDVTSERVSNAGKGALYAGSVFKGTQTSGRSAYDVEIRFLEVNLPLSTCSGYLTISNLTDTHPYLTTFFTAELVGETYGFLTGGRWGASEHDDLRHWGRFEQFRRPGVRADMVRPELYLREQAPVMGDYRAERVERASGAGGVNAQGSEGIAGMPGMTGTGPMRGSEKGDVYGNAYHEQEQIHAQAKGRDRDFVFMRIKERFLVPDHKVKDISGASFAGFYYAMLDLTPPADHIPPTSPILPRTPLSPLSPTTATSTYTTNTNNDRSASTSAGITGYFSSAFGRRASAAPGGPGSQAVAGTAVGGGSVIVGPPPVARRSSATVIATTTNAASTGTTPASATSTPTRRSSNASTSAAAGPLSPGAPTQMPPRRRRESSTRAVPEGPRPATIRGYYFHSLNQEPFQELFLTHVPSKSSGTFEIR